MIAFLASVAPAQIRAQGVPLSDRPMLSVSGKSVSPDDIKGTKGTVVLFWSNTCPWVERYESRTLEIITRFQKQGFGFIAVNSNDAIAYPADGLDEMKKQASDGKYSFEYVRDSGSIFANAIGAKRAPQVFVYNSAGVLSYQGAIDDNPTDAAGATEHYLEDALTNIASGSAVAPAETKAFGCTIKFQ